MLRPWSGTTTGKKASHTYIGHVAHMNVLIILYIIKLCLILFIVILMNFNNIYMVILILVKHSVTTTG